MSTSARDRFDAHLRGNLSRFSSHLGAREDARFRRLALSHFQEIPDAELERLARLPAPLPEAMVVGMVFSRLARVIWEAENRNEETRLYRQILGCISCGLDGRPLSSDSDPRRVEHGSAWVLALHRALDDLAQALPRAYEILMLRFFGGQTMEETARTLTLSMGQVQRLEGKGKAFVFDLMTQVGGV